MRVTSGSSVTALHHRNKRLVEGLAVGSSGDETLIRSNLRRPWMGDKTDEMKGRAKEAAGDLTDNDRLRREGRTDRAGATVKKKVNEGVDRAKKALNDD